MTLSDGVVFWVNHCVILPGAAEVQSVAAYIQLRGFHQQSHRCQWVKMIASERWPAWAQNHDMGVLLIHILELGQNYNLLSRVRSKKQS